MRVVLVQLAQVVGRRAAPAVDRLVVVAHRGERRAHPGELLQQAVLRDVGVLVFVDQDVAQAVLPFLAQFGVGIQQFGRQADQVVEIDRLVGAQGGVVAVVDLGVDARVVVFGGLQRGGGRLQFVLPQRDARHRAADFLLVGGLEDFRDDACGVGRIEDGKRRLQLGELRVLAQHAQAHRVEGGDDQALGVDALGQLGGALLHFARGLVGEGDGGDRARLVAAFTDQVGDLVGDDARLARAGAGQHQQRAVEVLRRFALRRIERGKQAHAAPNSRFSYALMASDSYSQVCLP